jgi:hypothetical protein
MLTILSNWKRAETSPGLLRPSLDTTLLIDAPVVLDTTRRILVLVEPEACLHLRGYAIQHAHLYDYILTYDREILNTCSNARLYLYGTTWIERAEWEAIDVGAKQFAVSGVVGSKAFTEGHLFRRAVYMNQHLFPIPTTMFIGQGAPLPKIRNNEDLGPRKTKLFSTFQFSLVIENSRQANYFTEKLCDCLITKTIPIYYGCPNIGEYFDTSGWILLDRPDVELVLRQLSMLNPEHYEAYFNTVLRNFETVKQYLDLDENLNRALRDIPGY